MSFSALHYSYYMDSGLADNFPVAQVPDMCRSGRERSDSPAAGKRRPETERFGSAAAGKCLSGIERPDPAAVGKYQAETER